MQWQHPRIRLESGMHLDSGGIGKEYAIDRCVELSVLVNFGGDLACTRSRGSPGLLVGEDRLAELDADGKSITLHHGGVPTSNHGD